MNTYQSAMPDGQPVSSAHIPFCIARNLADSNLKEGCPWHFNPDRQILTKLRDLPKKGGRDELLGNLATEWQVYSTVHGAIPGKRVGKDNPAAAVLGFAADYDMRTDLPEVKKWLHQMTEQFQPQIIESSLSRKIRLVWTFPKPVLVKDSQHAAALIEVAFEKMKVPTLLPGYDKASVKPTQVWTNGGEWHEWRKVPMDWQLVVGFAVDAGRKLSASRADISLETVQEEVRKRWPGRWQGEFKLDALGVRFWDVAADCPTGCQVKPDGMLCFTGPTGFIPWNQLFGATWVNTERALNLGKIAGETYFDGRLYYQKKGAHFFDMSRDDVLLDLAARGVETTKARGHTISDAGRVLHFIQNSNRVHGAAPLIYYPPGIVEISGMRILNTSTLRPTEPWPVVCVPADFPLLWKILSGLFIRRAGMLPLETFLAWLRRAYIALREFRPMMGQAIFLCGPVSNGKTLLCVHVLRPALGGRMANPYKYFVGETDFTDDLFGAALWAMNDEESPDERSKAIMLSKIKSMVVNPEQTYHPKFCKKLSLPWQGRFFGSLNDDGLSTGQLPDVNEATRDKLMFFATQPFDGIWPERHLLEAQIAAELPKFLRWLLDWTPPAAVLESGRMGVRSYFDPEILNYSQQQAYSYNLRELIAVWIPLAPEFQGNEAEWRGSPTRLIAAIGNNPGLVPLLKDWTVAKVAKSLAALARVPGSGVVFVDKSEREFRIIRSNLLRGADKASLSKQP